MAKLKTKNVLFQVRLVLTVIKVVFSDSSIHFQLTASYSYPSNHWERGRDTPSPSEDTHTHTHQPLTPNNQLLSTNSGTKKSLWLLYPPKL